MRLTPGEERLRLITDSMDARTLEEIHGLRSRIATWLVDHGTDDGLREVDERLERLAAELREQSPPGVNYRTASEEEVHLVRDGTVKAGDA